MDFSPNEELLHHIAASFTQQRQKKAAGGDAIALPPRTLVEKLSPANLGSVQQLPVRMYTYGWALLTAKC